MSDFRQNSVKLSELLEDVDSGLIKLPSFQRSYKWKPSQVKKLLDSIQKSHPAGSLLFLEVDSRRRIIQDEPFKFSNAYQGEAENLVLDGQQRLTSCYCAFYNKGTKSYYLDLQKLFTECHQQEDLNMLDFEPYIVVRRHVFLPDNLLAQHLLPLSFLRSKGVMREKLLSYKQGLRESGYNQDYINFLESKLESFLDAFFDYRFPVIILPKSLSIEAVCKVFQTINTTGLKLSAFDICVARFMATGINLKEKIKASKEAYDNLVPVLNQDETIVLQIIALLADKTPKKAKLPDILDESDIGLWDRAIEGLSMTIELLSNFGVGCNKDLSLLPYQPVIPVIAALMVDRDYNNQSEPIKSRIAEKVKKWFYSTALILRYTEGTDNKMKEDFDLLKKWMITDTTKPHYINVPIRWNLDQIIKTNKAGAVGKAVLCCMNYSKPSDFYTDKQVGVGSHIGTSQLHHVFPDGKYSRRYGELLNSVFNFTFLTPESNTYISNKRTNEYLEGILEERGIAEQSLKNILQKHLISEESFTAMKNEDYESFLRSRAETVRLFLNENIGLNVVIDENEEMEEMDIDDEFDLSNED